MSEEKKIPAYVARSKHWIYSINWIGVSIERWEEGDREKRSRRDTSIDLKYLTQYPVSDFAPGFSFPQIQARRGVVGSL